MANRTIEITPNGPNPAKCTVSPGETVTFQLVGIEGEVEVAFDTPCCFTSSAPLTLNSSSIAASHQDKTVDPNARDGSTSGFTATLPDTTPRRHHGGDHEVKRGEVDVSSDSGWFK